MENFDQIIESQNSIELIKLFKKVTIDEREDILYGVADYGYEMYDTIMTYILEDPKYKYDEYSYISYLSIAWDETRYLFKYSNRLSEYVKLDLLKQAIADGKLNCCIYLLMLFPNNYKFNLTSITERINLLDNIIDIDMDIFRIIVSDNRF